ncbi:MAG TPA: DUF748 domain-containing protein, partial [Methylomirabilota bacterium]|nr:DUF748 domain-containing protein [Methylomirabilota bacterium]
MAGRRVWVAIAVVLLVGLLLATVTFWLGLPGIARWAVTRQIEAQTGRQLAMAAFDIDVPRRRIHVAGFRLADRDPGAPLLEFDTLDVRFRLRDLLRGRVHLREITLAAPRLRIVRTARGVLNISDLLERPAEPTGPLAPFTLDRLAITGGTILFEDHTLTPPRAWRAEALTVEATSLSTMTPQPLGAARLATTVAGAPLVVEASGIALTPLQGRARLTLRDMDATLANLYLPSDTAVVLEKAKVDAAIDASRDAQGGVGLDGQARIDDIVVRRRGVDASLVTVPALVFTLTSSRSAEGRPLGRVEMTGQATVFDPRPGKSNRFQIDRLKLVADGIDASGRQPARVSATAALPGGGALDVQGSAQPAPVSAELRARISRVDLGFWAPYFSLPLVFTGMAETDLTLNAGVGTPRVRGRVAINGVTITDGTQRLAAADAVELTGLDTQWPKVRAERVRLKRPRATIRRDREGHLSITDLVETLKRPGREDTAPAPAAAAEKPPPLPPDFAAELGEVILEDARTRLDDATVEPPTRLRLAPIRLTVRDLTWPNRRPATVQLTASTPERGTIETQGTVTLDPVSFDLRTRLVGVDLAPYRPYLPLAARLDGHLEGDVTAKGTLGPKIEATAQGSIALADVAFRDGDRPILTVGRLEFAKLDYTWPATATVERVHMQKSWVLLERRADGSLPIAGILTPRRSPPAPAGESPAPRPAPLDLKLAVREVRFEDGAASVVDAAVSPTARIEVAGVRLTARDFAWPPRAPLPVQMEAPTPGSGRLSARGAIDLTKHALDLQVTPSVVDLAPMQPYLPVRGRVAGKASGDLQIKAALQPFGLSARGTASITDMALADDTRPLVTAAQLETTGIEFTWPASLTIDRVRLQKPWAQIERAADDSFPLAALLAPPAAPAGATPRESGPGRAAGSPALDLRVRRAGIEDGSFVIIDATERPAARAEIRDARLGIRNFTWPAREAVDVRLRANTATGGSVDARGQVRLDTQAVDLQITAKQLDLATAQAFLPSRGTLAGKVDSDLRVKGTLKPLSVAATGSLAVDDTIFGDGQRMLAYIKRVDLTGIDADWPRRATVQRMAIDKPWALVERETDGRLPLLDLLFPPAPVGTPAPVATPTPTAATAPRPPTTPRAAPAPRAEADAGPIIAVGELAVDEGFVRFVDRTTTPAFTEEASRMVVTGRTLGTVRNGKGPLAVNGRLSGGTPFEFKGTLGALTGPLNLDLDGKLTDFPLPRVNPYSNKLIGWIARRGAFGTTVRYRITNNVLTASNDIVLGQPDFVPSRSGDEVRDRVGVPLGTLISLLKNARGEVHLSVPVTGNVATREFDFSDAFWKAVRKTAISVMALPVSWVGKIFYSEDARVETIQIWPVYFEPGTVRFAEGFDQQAQRVGTFLRDAPGVKLAMKSVLTVDDIAALKRDVVRQRLEGAAREAAGG